MTVVLPEAAADTRERDRTIPLAEIFGPTIQGEGALAGRPTYFLRIGGCDYKCKWCDTAFAVNPEEVRKLERVTQVEIYEQLRDWKAAHPGPEWLAISGGNPAMYDLSLVVMEWQRNLAVAGQVTVETQGSRWQPWLAEVDMLTISPKPPSSGMNPVTSMANLISFMSQLSTRQWDLDIFCLKVICFDEADYTFAQEVHGVYPMAKFYLSTGTAMGGLDGKWVPPPIPGETTVRDGLYDPDLDPFIEKRDHPDIAWSRPATDTKEHLLRRYRWLVERAAADPSMADAAIFPQLHALIWGINTKGV